MLFTPKAASLKTENIEPGKYLSMFLNSLLSGKVSMQSCKRVNRLRLSIGEDLLYATSNETLLTPKIILFLIFDQDTLPARNLNITNWLGHGVSYSILEEMETKNAHKVLNKIKEVCLLPPECKEGIFTKMIADEIDRNEEILSGEISQNMKEKRLPHSLL